MLSSTVTRPMLELAGKQAKKELNRLALPKATSSCFASTLYPCFREDGLAACRHTAMDTRAASIPSKNECGKYSNEGTAGDGILQKQNFK